MAVMGTDVQTFWPLTTQYVAVPDGAWWRVRPGPTPPPAR